MPRSRSDPETLLPLKPVVFQVLLSLAGGERHGYGLVQDIARRTAARMRLEPGNLATMIAGGQLLSAFLYGVSPADPATVISLVVFFGATVMAATARPLHRALRIDPAVTLRENA